MVPKTKTCSFSKGLSCGPIAIWKPSGRSFSSRWTNRAADAGHAVRRVGRGLYGAGGRRDGPVRMLSMWLVKVKPLLVVDSCWSSTSHQKISEILYHSTKSGPSFFAKIETKPSVGRGNPTKRSKSTISQGQNKWRGNPFYPSQKKSMGNKMQTRLLRDWEFQGKPKRASHRSDRRLRALWICQASQRLLSESRDDGQGRCWVGTVFWWVLVVEGGGASGH